MPGRGWRRRQRGDQLQRPVLDAKPKHLPQADAIAEREETLVAAIANAVISQTLVRLGARNLALGLPLGAMVYANVRAGD